MCVGYVTVLHSQCAYDCALCVCTWCYVVCARVSKTHSPFACVGKSHDQSVGLPKGLQTEKIAFGLSTIKGTYNTHTHTHTHTCSCRHDM